MKVGDLVMFMNEEQYARWFYGKLGIVLRTRKNMEGVDYCRVKWLEPVSYHGKYTSVSSFRCDYFEGCENESR